MREPGRRMHERTSRHRDGVCFVDVYEQLRHHLILASSRRLRPSFSLPIYCIYDSDMTHHWGFGLVGGLKAFESVLS